MKRLDFYLLGLVVIAALIVFLPLFTGNFVFMDEALQLWGYKSVPGFYMFIDEGRYLMEVLCRWLFNYIDTIADLKYMRLFSLFGWLLCLPIWYAVMKREVANVALYKYLPFFACLYLVTNPSFLIAVQWAACLQFFISDTASLLAGAIVINSLRSGQFTIRKLWWPATVALLLGLFALFFYQGSWSCFLLPFLLYFLNPTNDNKDKVLIAGAVAHLFVYAAYFVVYKLSFYVFDSIPEDPRNKLSINPIIKLAFFFARPLHRSFRFTLLTEEKSYISWAYYLLMLASLVALTFKRFGKNLQAVKYLVIVVGFGLMAYLPGLLIAEHYASNRTLFTLNLVVFIVCFEMALHFIKSRLVLQVGAVAMALFFMVCARFNLNQGFIRPLVAETAALKSYIAQHYNKNIQTVHFIRPPEDILAKKYHINYSMDEFGVPSSFFVWVPEPQTKQMIYEACGSRETAGRVVVKHWVDREAYAQSGEKADSTVLLVDVKAIIDTITP